jgi:hypothetical protein
VLKFILKKSPQRRRSRNGSGAQRLCGAERTRQMNSRIKKYLFSGILLFIGYFLASRHIVINEKDFRLLKKSQLTYEYTFYNVTDKDPEDIIKIDMLREDGIGDTLVDFGLVSEEEKYRLEAYYNASED